MPSASIDLSRNEERRKESIDYTLARKDGDVVRVGDRLKLWATAANTGVAASPSVRVRKRRLTPRKKNVLAAGFGSGYVGGYGKA